MLKGTGFTRGENVGDRIGSFSVCCFLSSEGPETPRVMKDGVLARCSACWLHRKDTGCHLTHCEPSGLVQRDATWLLRDEPVSSSHQWLWLSLGLFCRDLVQIFHFLQSHNQL